LALPVSFLLGLFVVLGHDELSAPVPGESTPERLAVAALLLLLPSLLAAIAGRVQHRRLISGRPPRVPPRALLRLSTLATPTALAALVTFGAYGDVVDRLSPDNHLLRAVLWMAPLYLADVPRLVVASHAAALGDYAEQAAGRIVSALLLPRLADVWPSARLSLGWPLLAVLPLLTFGLALELLRLDRDVYVFVLGTAAGTTLGTLGFLVALAALLPFWFRRAFGLRRHVPEPAGAVVRDTARRLGFRPDRVLYLPTGMRVMNAMMIGPLPVGRCLALTDALVHELDGDALSGVVGHEIGHARMGHPGLLMLLAVVVPLLLLTPLRHLPLDELDTFTQGLLAAAVVALGALVVRAVAHRFEHEADAASVQALGPGPVSRALLFVTQLSMPVMRGFVGRLFTLHPNERERVSRMHRYASDEPYRRAFDRRGVRLRRGLTALVALAAVAGAWSFHLEGRYEQVVWLRHTGRFADARAAAAAITELPPRWTDAFSRMRAELDATAELDPTANDWPTAQGRIAERALDRAFAELRARGPAAARPWFSLALDRSGPVPLVHRTLHDFCAAAAAGDPERLAAAADVVRRIGVPEGLGEVFR
jgi:Zn-dependent protease with chaperone function